MRADRRRRRPARPEERRSQPAPHRHDRRGADDRSGPRHDGTRRRPVGQGVDRLDVRALGQGRLLRHRRPRRGPSSPPRSPARSRQSDVVAAAPASRRRRPRRRHRDERRRVRLRQIDALLDLDVTGRRVRPRRRAPGGRVVDEAKAIGAGLGDTLDRRDRPTDRHVEATIVGLFDDQAILSEDYLFDTSVLADAGIDAERRVAGRLDRRRRLAGSRRGRSSPGCPTQYPNASVETATSSASGSRARSTRC